MTNNTTHKFPPETHTRWSVFVPNDLLEQYKSLHGKPLGSQIVILLRDFILHEELKKELKRVESEKN